MFSCPNKTMFFALMDDIKNARGAAAPPAPPPNTSMHIHLVTANRNANSKLVIAVQLFENMLRQSAQYNKVHSGRPL